MKSVSIIALLLCFSILSACKKTGQKKSDYPFIYLQRCINKTFGDDQVQLCFDAVVSDSRCPTNAVCIWEGVAVAKFTFIKDGDSHPLTLSTQALNVPYAKDTTVEGYKIEFVDLRPHPVAGEDPPHSNQINAQVKISKL
jgi:hypothetical protein